MCFSVYRLCTTSSKIALESRRAIGRMIDKIEDEEDDLESLGNQTIRYLDNKESVKSKKKK